MKPLHALVVHPPLSIARDFIDYPYEHLDIAGPAFLDRPVTYYGKGGTGVGVRLLTHFLTAQSRA
jgi:leucyl aminopeptidase